MKRFLFLVFLGFIPLMIFLSEHATADQPLPPKLEHAIKQTRMMEYHDDDYDYVVRHPQFFEQTADCTTSTLSFQKVKRQAPLSISESTVCSKNCGWRTT